MSYLLAHLEEKIPFVQLGAEVGIWPVLCIGLVLPAGPPGGEDPLCSAGGRGGYLTCAMYRCCPTCWSTWRRRSPLFSWGRVGYLTCAVYRHCPNCWFILSKDTPLFSLGQRWVSYLCCDGCCPSCWFIGRKDTPLFRLGQRWVSFVQFGAEVGI